MLCVQLRSRFTICFADGVKKEDYMGIGYVSVLGLVALASSWCMKAVTLFLVSLTIIFQTLKIIFMKFLLDISRIKTHFHAKINKLVKLTLVMVTS